MFLLSRPSTADVERFLRESKQLPLSYDTVGLRDRRPRATPSTSSSCRSAGGDRFFTTPHARFMTGSTSISDFAYGTLANHAERGEELFEVRRDPRSDEVSYRIRAASRPSAWLARLGLPIVRALQAKCRRDSATALRAALNGRTS